MSATTNWKHKRRRKDAGFAALLSVLMAAIIFSILMAISIPNIQRLQFSVNRSRVVELMRRVQMAELYSTNIYQDGFRSPGALSMPRTFPATCEASGLLDGNTALPSYAGYNLSFSFTGTQLPAPAPGCTVPGFTGFVMSATPIQPGNGRSYWLSSTDLVLRYSDSPGGANGTSAPWVN